MNPSSRTVFQGVARLRAGHSVAFENGRARVMRHWQPRFEEDRREPFAALKGEFRALIEAAVRREAEGQRTGAFSRAWGNAASCARRFSTSC